MSVNRPEQIINSAAIAANYAEYDIATALIHARKAAEGMCREIYESNLGQLPNRITFGEVIAVLSNETNVLPRKAEYAFRVIQNFGNISAHPSENADDCLEPAFEFFKVIVSWYFRDHKQTNIPQSIQFKTKSNPVFPVDGEPVIDLSPLVITPELWRIYCLFGYEEFGGGVLWKEPEKFNDEAARVEMMKLYERVGLGFHEGITYDEVFNQWLNVRRKFSHTEIVNSEWYEFYTDHNTESAITGLTSYNFKVDGTYFVGYDDVGGWDTGEWFLIDGILRLKSGYNSLYVTDVFANKSGIHSAVHDDRDGKRDHYSVFTKVKR